MASCCYSEKKQLTRNRVYIGFHRGPDALTTPIS